MIVDVGLFTVDPSFCLSFVLTRLSLDDTALFDPEFAMEYSEDLPAFRTMDEGTLCVCCVFRSSGLVLFFWQVSFLRFECLIDPKSVCD